MEEENDNDGSGPHWMIKFCLGWNALMITACCKALQLWEMRIQGPGLQKHGFLEEKMKGEGQITHFYHNCKERTGAATETDGSMDREKQHSCISGRLCISD